MSDPRKAHKEILHSLIRAELAARDDLPIKSSTAFNSALVICFSESGISIDDLAGESREIVEKALGEFAILKRVWCTETKSWRWEFADNEKKLS